VAAFTRDEGRRIAANVAKLPDSHPRNLSHAPSNAVTPISPAAQKFHLLILCSFLDNSVISSNPVPSLVLGKWHIADANQNIADPHAAIIAPV